MSKVVGCAVCGVPVVVGEGSDEVALCSEHGGRLEAKVASQAALAEVRR